METFSKSFLKAIAILIILILLFGAFLFVCEDIFGLTPHFYFHTIQKNNMPEENLYTKDCIRTYTGIYMNVFEPTLDMICIEDIAHALSMQCRFGGHLRYFFSVAQHCTNCFHLVEGLDNKLATLLHDASEAYLLDIPRPIKNKLANYKEIENKLMLLISEKFGFAYPLSKEVKDIDEKMLQLEWDCLMLQKNNSIVLKNSYEAKEDFITAYKLYKNK